MTPDLDRLLASDAPEDLAVQSLHELRALRRTAQEWESAVSMTRRLAHGRMDILGYELRRRQGNDDHGASQLLYDLPDILAETSTTGGGRAVQVEAPGPAAEALAAVLDRVVTPAALGRPEELPDDELPVLFDQLAALERTLSEARRGLHERIDDVQAEIGRRYRDGEASIDSLLR